jgi:hypothetical protein
MTSWNPFIPGCVECSRIGQVGEVDDDLKQPGPVAPQLHEGRIDLGEDLPHLAAHVQPQILGYLDPVSDAVVDHDVRPACRLPAALNFTHEDILAFLFPCRHNVRYQAGILRYRGCEYEFRP